MFPVSLTQQTYLSTTQAAKLIGVTPPTIIRMAKDREIGYLRIGTRYKFRQADIEEYMKGATKNVKTGK